MRHRARFLHVLASAPVAALMVVALGPSVRAQSPSHRPVPYVVAIDAGHGGSPDNNKPQVPFDPGVIGPTGLLEKDVTLDVAKRVQALLEAQGVQVVMTRTEDVYVGIETRTQTAIDNHAALFVSIHMNSFPDPATGGATVLYPGNASAPFAQVMSDTLGTQLKPLGLTDDGILLRDDLWIHAPMPAITVEGAYLSNPREEALMRLESSREVLADAIVAGIDRAAPVIATIHRAMVAWEASHGGQPAPSRVGHAAAVVVPRAGGFPMRNLVLLVMVIVMWWQRRVVVPLIGRAGALGRHVGAHAAGWAQADTAMLDSTRSARERRHQRLNRGRRRTLLEHSRAMAPQRQVAPSRAVYHSVYDDLRL